VDYNEYHAKRMASQLAERALRLKAALEVAEISGKERFDLDRFYALWRDNPDARLASLGVIPPEEERRRGWEETYYLTWPQIQSLEEFVGVMKEAQANGCFD
jgi:hypothetical protein